MLRMALNRHELARYRRQRKQGLLTQLALMIARCASLSPIIQAEEMFIKTVLTFKPCWHASFLRAVMVWYGLVWFGLARV